MSYLDPMGIDRSGIVISVLKLETSRSSQNLETTTGKSTGFP